MTPQDILHFWFEELTPQQHFSKDAALDSRMRERFGTVLDIASVGGLQAWRVDSAGTTGAAGRLAEIIVLDQFSRNIHRDTPRAFAQDALALMLAREFVTLKLDAALPMERRLFTYMPYMHSEHLGAHREAVPLFSQPGLEENLRYLHLHTAIIERFGRYPHRNAVLDRISTPDEVEFLRQPGSSF